ncbi:glycerophosphodiester phosphodiesterase family protein [Paenibacillus oryzisoli]|uniref:Glycerophosphodiester phosphodiesterase n=1 Tax=Paenibacillus oryzisoli TaxID=1850517 RepID=A0A198A5Q4_9BACL|nr:glycerophosphodiester phosphodiesterase family protein [Paenibacillus oryzisoli]OAS16386.1 glycerophosphodiester phosphodiesterase [Paenibacillus oryzisoli]
MKRLRKLFRSKLVWAVLILIGFIYVNNTSLLAKERSGPPFLMAHRGLAQTFHTENLKNDTCTAERIYEPEHPYLENTIPSMQAAFDAGADEVELDIHITKDDQFAVFHDWTLDCRTNVTGQSKDYTMAELKKADIGYGYTADNGKSYPFRGKGIGLMPSLQEVFTQFSDKMLLIHIKTNDRHEGNVLGDMLAKLSPERRSQLTIYGGDLPLSMVKDKLPDMRVISVDAMKSCLLPYLAYGWTGMIPGSCEHIQIHIPEKLAPLLWGWPNKFLNRMDHVDTRVIVVGGNGTEFSTGFDTREDLERLPDSFSGGIWTNRIDRIAPIYK